MAPTAYTPVMETRPESPPAGREAALVIGFLAALPAALLFAVVLIWAGSSLLLWLGVG